MSVKLFVGGLSWGTDSNSLRCAFEQYGLVEECNVITDRETGRSRGFGFVSYSDSNHAQKAVDAMNGTELDGRNIKVDLASERSSGGGNRSYNDRSGGYNDRSGGRNYNNDRGGNYRDNDRNSGGGGYSQRSGNSGGYKDRSSGGYGGGRNQNDDWRN